MGTRYDVIPVTKESGGAFTLIEDFKKLTAVLDCGVTTIFHVVWVHMVW